MLNRLGVAFGGAVLALAGLLAGGAGSAGASPGPASTTPLPTSTPTLTCPPVLPISGSVAAVTTTSVTISYALFLSPPCGYDPPVTVTLFASQDDAQQWLDPVGAAVSGPERSGKLTVDGLTPDTAYWFRFTAGGHRDPYVLASVRTAAVPVCAATLQVDSVWSGGFVARVTVRNVGTETLDSWRVSWRWPGDERIQSLWNGVAVDGGNGDVTVRDSSYNATLSPGDSTTFGMLVATTAPPGAFALTCGR